jgi:hypothetical protein
MEPRSFRRELVERRRYYSAAQVVELDLDRWLRQPFRAISTITTTPTASGTLVGGDHSPPPGRTWSRSPPPGLQPARVAAAPRPQPLVTGPAPGQCKRLPTRCSHIPARRSLPLWPRHDRACRPRQPRPAPLGAVGSTRSAARGSSRRYPPRIPVAAVQPRPRSFPGARAQISCPLLAHGSRIKNPDSWMGDGHPVPRQSARMVAMIGNDMINNSASHIYLIANSC